MESVRPVPVPSRHCRLADCYAAEAEARHGLAPLRPLRPRRPVREDMFYGYAFPKQGDSGPGTQHDWGIKSAAKQGMTVASRQRRGVEATEARRPGPARPSSKNYRHSARLDLCPLRVYIRDEMWGPGPVLSRAGGGTARGHHRPEETRAKRLQAAPGGGPAPAPAARSSKHRLVKSEGIKRATSKGQAEQEIDSAGREGGQSDTRPAVVAERLAAEASVSESKAAASVEMPPSATPVPPLRARPAQGPPTSPAGSPGRTRTQRSCDGQDARPTPTPRDPTPASTVRLKALVDPGPGPSPFPATDLVYQIMQWTVVLHYNASQRLSERPVGRLEYAPLAEEPGPGPDPTTHGNAKEAEAVRPPASSPDRPTATPPCCPWPDTPDDDIVDDNYDVF
ncbi:Zinc metalloprotease [Frankliniella fusca]|uniref:Zinc metalloprotease n=1 Tax=Frankliniella fusca TaxID=407009 RepID=A0AAE1H070_9NEOP|nr:Zinc metalloprotease [Frankliniella fusca]